MQHQQVGCDLARTTVVTANPSAIIINAPALSLEIVDFEVFMSWWSLATYKLACKAFQNWHAAPKVRIFLRLNERELPSGREQNAVRWRQFRPAERV
jgi:hypothetical protein